MVDRLDAASGPLQEDKRFAARVAVLLEVDRVQLRDLQFSRPVRLNLGKKIAQALRRLFHVGATAARKTATFW